MRIVLISDVHGKWNKVEIPECDLLISAGDYSFTGETHMVRDFHKWLNKQPAKHIISVQGNHEKAVEKNFSYFQDLAREQCPRVHFIDEGFVEVEGKNIWCSAITPWFHNWAWNRFPDEIIKHWDKIPNGIDILVTHGPPHGILDKVLKFNGPKCEWEEDYVGCPQLLKKVLEIKPKLHVFGHIHQGYGEKIVGGIQFVNASLLDDQYQLVNKPFIYNLE